LSSSSSGEDSISYFDRVKNAALQLSMFKMNGPICHKLDGFRRDHGMGRVRDIQNEFPPQAHITQLPACLDHPRSTLPNNFYYAGPFVDETARPVVEFPWNRLDGRPFIYASLGTVKKNGHLSVFRLIAEACKGLDLQLVISLGDRYEPEIGDELPGNPLVVRYAPQLELLKRAKLVITHGGPNTVFEALMEGKPMIAIPMAHDQPAIADRLARLKVAEVLRIENLSAMQLRLALEKLLYDASYSNAAMEVGARIRSERGLERATEIIERFVHSDQAFQG
jgi:MGT family glycosyltransferase